MQKAIGILGEAIEHQKDKNPNLMWFEDKVDKDFFAALKRGDDMKWFSMKRKRLLEKDKTPL